MSDDHSNKTLVAADSIADDSVDANTDSYLRSTQNIIDSINANLPPGSSLLKPIPHDVVLRRGDAESAQAAVHSVFQMLGGASGMLAWAIDHRDPFYTVIYPKLLKSEQDTAFGGGQINIITPIPATPADSVVINSSGRAFQTIDHDDDLADDDDLVDEDDE